MWFWHVLALALGRTVSELQSVMTPREFSDWISFYKAYPFDDLHRYHRPAAMIGASMGGDYQTKIDFLCPPEVPEGMNEIDVSVMRAFGVRK